MDLVAPEGLSYLPYQEEGIRYCLGRKNILLADSMGLGKTIQAIGWINNDPSIEKVLIICPASLKWNWYFELQKWLTRKMSIQVVDGDIFNYDVDIVIINYNLLWRERFMWLIHGTVWGLVVADECHNIKSPDAKQTKGVLGEWGGKPIGRLGEEESHGHYPILASRKLLMTGTPLLNFPCELWTLCNYLWPRVFWSEYAFYTKYCGWTKANKDKKGSTNPGELRGLLKREGFLRRLKSEVLKDLPPKSRQVITLPAPSSIKHTLDQENMVWSLSKESKEAVEKAVEASAIYPDDAEEIQALNKELRSTLRDVSVAFPDISLMRKAAGLAKIPLAIDYIKSLLDGGVDKLVAFACHHEVLDEIVDGLKGYGCIGFDGRQGNMKERALIVERFQKDPNIRVFWGSIAAAGVGITLTAASTGVFVEGCWTPALMSQAEDRMARIGQKRNVHIVHLVFNDSLDSKMVLKTIAKQEVIDEVLDGKGGEENLPNEVSTGHQEPPTKEARERKKVLWKAIGDEMSDLQHIAVHDCIKALSGMDSDKASARNNKGFSKADSRMGEIMSNCIKQHGKLTHGMSALGAKIVLKYHRQLDPRLIELLEPLKRRLTEG
jgi:SWI/SNF-related matrix-associated actin-dependent regulator 1 of chromatin subfamily A